LPSFAYACGSQLNENAPQLNQQPAGAFRLIKHGIIPDRVKNKPTSSEINQPVLNRKDF
jgi:hypothetical protein